MSLLFEEVCDVKERGLNSRIKVSCSILHFRCDMETPKSSTSKLVVMTILEPKDELDEVQHSPRYICCTL